MVRHVLPSKSTRSGWHVLAVARKPSRTGTSPTRASTAIKQPSLTTSRPTATSIRFFPSQAHNRWSQREVSRAAPGRDFGPFWSDRTIVD